MAAKGEREVRVRFTGESAVLKGAAGEVRKVFTMMQADINDTRSASEKLAAAQKQVADSMTKDMKEIGRAADVVRDSLGPEMTAAIEASGRSVEDQVQEWRKLGLTLDEIKMDSSQLADGMKALDTAARQSAGEVGDGFKKISAEADNSRGVMSNFAGNAIQELPGVAGAFGPLNMAISQFVEYATEGNIKLKGLVGMGAGIGIVAGAMQAVADRSAKVAEIEAFKNDAISGYTESLKTADSRLQGIIKHLTEAGKIETQIGDSSGDWWTGGVSTTVDMTAVLTTMGLTVADVSKLIDGGTEKIEAWGAAAIKGGANADVVNLAMEGLTQQAEFLATATKNAATYQAFLGDEEKIAAQRAKVAEEQADAYAQALEEQKAKAEAASQAQRDLYNAQMSMVDAGFAARDAQDTYTSSLEALAIAVDDPKTGVDELRQAQDDAAQAAIGMALANQASAENLSALAGAPLTAAQSHQVLIDSLYKTALALAPDSPLRAQLVEYIGTLQFVPGEVSTTVTANTDDALGRIGGVQSAVDDLGTTSAEAETDAETQTALDKVTILQGAVDGLAEGVSIPIVLVGDEDTKARLASLRTSLQQTIDKANEADRAVARVAG